MEVCSQRHAPAALSPVKRTGTPCTGPVWTDAQNLQNPPGLIRSLHRPLSCTVILNFYIPIHFVSFNTALSFNNVYTCYWLYIQIPAYLSTVSLPLINCNLKLALRSVSPPPKIKPYLEQA
jgi:hypothetical protein